SSFDHLVEWLVVLSVRWLVVISVVPSVGMKYGFLGVPLRNQRNTLHLRVHLHAHRQPELVARPARDARQNHLPAAYCQAQAYSIRPLVLNLDDARRKNIGDAGALRCRDRDADIASQYTGAHHLAECTLDLAHPQAST